MRKMILIALLLWPAVVRGQEESPAPPKRSPKVRTVERRPGEMVEIEMVGGTVVVEEPTASIPPASVTIIQPPARVQFVGGFLTFYNRSGPFGFFMVGLSVDFKRAELTSLVGGGFAPSTTIEKGGGGFGTEFAAFRKFGRVTWLRLGGYTRFIWNGTGQGTESWDIGAGVGIKGIFARNRFGIVLSGGPTFGGTAAGASSLPGQPAPPPNLQNALRFGGEIGLFLSLQLPAL